MPDIKRDRSIFIFLKRLTDALLPLALLYLVACFYGVVWEDRYNLLGLIGGLLFVVTNQIYGAYDNWRTRSLFESLQLVVKSWGTTVAMV
jgi:putative colanic acid biosysnthesis UDP-glucose lipid carrier transferase